MLMEREIALESAAVGTSKQFVYGWIIIENIALDKMAKIINKC